MRRENVVCYVFISVKFFDSSILVSGTMERRKEMDLQEHILRQQKVIECVLLIFFFVYFIFAFVIFRLFPIIF